MNTRTSEAFSQITFQIKSYKTWGENSENSSDVSAIPSMLRRRLSQMGRTALCVAIPLTNEFGDMPIVYVSRHGELKRTLGMLQDMAHGELLSPTAFSLSVHNAVAGLYSIHTGSKCSITALSGGIDNFIPGILEAIGMLSTQEPQILCVFCDEPLPAIYLHQEPSPSKAFAIGMVISAGDQLQLRNIQGTKDRQYCENAANFIEFLEGNGDHIVFANHQSEWLLSKRI